MSDLLLGCCPEHQQQTCVTCRPEQKMAYIVLALCSQTIGRMRSIDIDTF